MTDEDLVCRLRRFAQENEPGHIYGSAISDLLEEAAREIDRLRNKTFYRSPGDRSFDDDYQWTDGMISGKAR